MNKKLIAVAVAGALAAPVVALAQSSVSISGLVDLGFGSVNGVGNVNGVQTADQRRIAQNGSATTAIVITGSEEVSKGFTAIFRYEMNPDFTGGTGLVHTAGASPGTVADTTGTATNGISLGNGANGYNFVGLQSNWGKFLMGRLNSPTLGAWGVASVFGTALGSGYGTSLIYTRHSGTANYNQSAPTRFNNAMEYTSPTMSGVTGRVLYVPKVDKAGIGTGGACAQTACTSEELRAAGSNRAGVTDFSLAYSAGPANAMIARQTVDAGSNGMSALVTPTKRTTGKNILTTLAGNYKFGDTTANLGWWTEDDKTSAGVQNNQTKGYSIGASHVMGRTTFRASAARNNSTISTNIDNKLLGFGVDYELSKRTSLYGRFEDRDANTNSSVDDVTHGITRTWHGGVRHTF